MSMQRVTVRLPEHVVRAYDRADGNRSKLMRRQLTEGISDGTVDGVPDDLRTLASVEDVMDRGKLNKRRGTFRKRCAQFFREKWESGYVPPADADSMSQSWRDEAALYGEDYLAWVEAILSWYAENWEVTDAMRADWPDAGSFYARVDPDAVEVEDRLVKTMRDAAAEGLEKDEAIRRVSKFHPDVMVEQAANRAYSGGGD